MTEYRAVLTITQAFESRARADQRLEQIVEKVPDSWEIREESVRRE